VTTELVLLGTAGAPLPCPGRAGISSVVIAGERIFVIDCGRGSPSGFAGAGLSFARLEAVLLTLGKKSFDGRRRPLTDLDDRRHFLWRTRLQ